MPDDDSALLGLIDYADQIFHALDRGLIAARAVEIQAEREGKS